MSTSATGFQLELMTAPNLLRRVALGLYGLGHTDRNLTELGVAPS